MYKYENAKFDDIKFRMIDEILFNIYELLTLHKHLFLTEKRRFNGFLKVNTTICSFFMNCNPEFNTFKQINYKILSIEDFLYRSLEDITQEFKIQLTYEFNSMEEVHKLNFPNISIVHRSFATFIMKE